MYSTRPYQAYSFRCCIFNNSVLAFVVSVLPQDLVFPSFIPFHSYFCYGGFVMLLSSTHLFVLSGSCSFHAYPFNRSVVPILHKFFSPYQALQLYSTRVLPQVVLPCPSLLTEVFNFVHLRGIFTLSTWLNLFQGSLVSLVCQRSNLVLPLLFLFRFSLRCHSRSRDEILS